MSVLLFIPSFFVLALGWLLTELLPQDTRIFYCEKIRVFKADVIVGLNTLAWNNGYMTRLVLFCWFAGSGVMINRDSWGYSYFERQR